MAVIEAIETTYLEADAASVTFSGIPSTYEHLQVRMSVRDGAATSRTYLFLRFNSDTTEANYSRHWMSGIATAVAGAAGTSQTRIGGIIASAGTPAGSYSTVIVDVLDYANANKNTTASYLSGVADSYPALFFGSVLWDDTAAVTSISLSDASGLGANLVRGSEFTLYGLNSA
jgi:hypothetical protein